LTLPWPCPVAPSEPNSSALIPATRSTTPSSASEAANMPAARIGPTVCELDGPMPTLKRSKALIVTSDLLLLEDLSRISPPGDQSETGI
jgi:hypothetical protein